MKVDNETNNHCIFSLLNSHEVLPLPANRVPKASLMRLCNVSKGVMNASVRR